MHNKTALWTIFCASRRDWEYAQCAAPKLAERESMPHDGRVLIAGSLPHYLAFATLQPHTTSPQLDSQRYRAIQYDHSASHRVFIYTTHNQLPVYTHLLITTAKEDFSYFKGSHLMALLSIRGDWYIYLWLIYCKVYSAIIWVFGNHCRGADKACSVITAGVSVQSPGGLHRVRTRRRKSQQQHRSKHIVALARRPSLRRIVMAPGASTAHAMMEDKEKTLHATVAMHTRRISHFAPLLIALVGLPARGKSHLAHRLSRHLNWNGESTKVFDCSQYRRQHMALYGSHDIFRADNLQGSAIRRQSAREAVQDAVLWLKDGNSVAGICEGLTYEEMQERFPQEFAWRDQDKLRYRYPWGESYIDIMTRLRPVLSALEDDHNVVVVGHQAVLRCMLGYFLDAKLDELPYMNVPLHTIVKLTSYGYKYKMEMIKMPVECVDTHRKQPMNCSITRSASDALTTVPSHYDTLPSNLWQNTAEAQV
ncbi:hypothetical protein evm_009882 [Chilo suppressalis]|nr:hypothetical protein evm_009882 [Chilo suppressalis]